MKATLSMAGVVVGETGADLATELKFDQPTEEVLLEWEYRRQVPPVSLNCHAAHPNDICSMCPCSLSASDYPLKEVATGLLIVAMPRW
eukprot:2482087-Amphidinium_carterae.2